MVGNVRDIRQWPVLIFAGRVIDRLIIFIAMEKLLERRRSPSFTLPVWMSLFRKKVSIPMRAIRSSPVTTGRLRTGARDPHRQQCHRKHDLAE